MNVSKRIDIPSVYNLRDLGGIVTKDNEQIVSGKLFRANSLSSISNDDLVELRKLNISKIYDLRSIDEREEKPDVLIGNEENIHVPIMERADLGIDKNQLKKPWYTLKVIKESFSSADAALNMMRKIYRGFVADEYSQRKYEFLLKDILNELKSGGSIMYHCSSGKDRTGLTTAYLLEILGVSKKDIFEDYLYSNNFIGRDAQYYLDTKFKLLLKFSRRKTKEAIVQIVKDFMGVREEYLLEAYKYVEDNYGSMDNYLISVLHIDDDLKQQFRTLLLK